MQDPLKYFRVEARELQEQLQSGLLELERNGSTAERLQRLLRLAHTLKGAARVVKQLTIANLSHQLEELLVPFRETERAVSAAEMEALLGVVDAIAEQVAGLAPAPTAAESIPPPAAPQPERSPAPETEKQASAKPLEEPRGSSALDHVEGLMDGVAEVGFQLGGVRRALPDLSASQRLADQLRERLEQRRAALTPESWVMVRALASELGARLTRLERELSGGVERATRELGQVRDRVDQLRLVPAGSIFGALERTLRDASVSLGKATQLDTQGGDVRLDSGVLTVVQRALVQAVRNAVAHGIETTAQRSARGKPAQGRISLEVERRGRQIWFSCRDDGRGVDLPQVRREAERLGRVQAGSATAEGELLSLLLQGGISTSTQLSQVAGRGVGLDLIRAALESVGGTASLSSEAGLGTRVTLRVPASLSALEALIVEVSGALYAVPLTGVVQALRVTESELTRTAEGSALAFEGKLVPFVPLARLLGSVASVASSALQTKTWSAVILQSGEQRLALGVERLLGSESLVARPLPDSVSIDDVVAGVTLDADGTPRLLLDLEALILAAQRAPSVPDVTAEVRRAILVVDDSLTTRMLEQSILESAGYEVELATSGEQGLEKARARRFDLILVDVEMPGMDGFEFVTQVRADAHLAHTPTVLVTSRASSDDLARGKAVGADGHIAKGEFDQVDFLNRIDRLMR